MISLGQLSAQFGKLDVNTTPQTPELRWVQSLDLVYGTKNPILNKHKVVLVDGDKLHHQLRCMENQERASRDHNGGVPNYVVAAMSFVVSDRTHVKGGHHGRRVIVVPLRFHDQNTTHVTKVYSFDKTVKDKKTYKRSDEFTQHLLADSPADKHEQIKLYHNKATNTFSERYHHSERALWGALRTDELVQQVAAELLRQLDPLSQNVEGIKVYCAALDIHSTRYLCSNCEPSSFEFQKPTGSFLDRLQVALARTCVFSKKHGITLLTRVSAEDEGGRGRKELNDHKPCWNDRNIRSIRTLKTNLVLQRDDRTTNASSKVEQQFGLFVSNQRINAAEPVYIVARRDNATSALELTASNKQFLTHITENEQRARDIVKQVSLLRTTTNDRTQLLLLIETAYQLCPHSTEVWAEYCAIYRHNNMPIESLDFALRLFMLYRRERGNDDYYTKEWSTVFTDCFTNTFPLIQAGDKNAIAKLKSIKAVFNASDYDTAELYLLRAIYFEKTGEKPQALYNLEKGLSLLDAESAKQIRTLFTV